MSHEINLLLIKHCHNLAIPAFIFDPIVLGFNELLRLESREQKRTYCGQHPAFGFCACPKLDTKRG